MPGPDTDVYEAVHAAANWLDEHNGAHDAEHPARTPKATEEHGEAAAAWIGATGQNPRKGTTHNYADVAAELGDVAFAALVAIDSLGHHPATILRRCAAKVTGRVEPVPVVVP